MVPAADTHRELWDRVKQALAGLPAYFRTETNIEGVLATDIFTLNSTLGASIEEQVVATLNSMRPVWDPDGRYGAYHFIRQSQTFPDVLLARQEPGTTTITDILFGMELKGWYLLAKEGEPSYRYRATAAACAEKDLLVVVPWYLSNVLSGRPKVLPPFIESAWYAAEYRNYHWEHIRASGGSKVISRPQGVAPYPSARAKIVDEPKQDRGSNFGRFARTGLMDTYLKQVEQDRIAGIEASYWRDFFKLFQDNSEPAAIRRAFDRLQRKVGKAAGKTPEPESSLVAQIVDAIGMAISPENE